MSDDDRDDHDDPGSRGFRTPTGIPWNVLSRAMRWETFALLAVVLVLTLVVA